MRILLARHGETPWNAEGRYQGQEDIALSPVGQAQARALGERLRDVPITRAVASPLARARRTAELALGESLPTVPLPDVTPLPHVIPLSNVIPSEARDLLSSNEQQIPHLRFGMTSQEAANGRALRPARLLLDPGLMEIAHGTWEGLLASEIGERDGERLRAWRDAPHEVLMPQGESLQHVFDRAWPALARAAEGLGVDDTLLVVAHDAVNRVLLCRILGIPLARLWGFRQAPTTLNLLEGPDVDHLEVVRLNDCSHHTALFGEAVHRAL